MPIIYFAKFRETGIIPSKTDENAGYDIYADFKEDYKIINPHETVMIPTSIVSAFDKHWYFQLFERGSTGTKGIGQRCGVIDSCYRGEWFIPITNHNTKPIIIYKDVDNLPIGDFISYPYKKALAQAVLIEVPVTSIKEISYSEIMKFETARGVGMLGSSGK